MTDSEFRLVDARCHCGRWAKVERVLVDRYRDRITLVAAVCAKHGPIWCKSYSVWP